MNNPNFGALAGFDDMKPVKPIQPTKSPYVQELSLLEEKLLADCQGLSPSPENWIKALNVSCWLGTKSAQHMKLMAPHHMMNSVRMLRENRHSTLKGEQAERAIKLLVEELETRLVRGYLDPEKERADVEKFLK